MHPIWKIITKTKKLSYHIIDDKYLLKNIISYNWWYFPPGNYHIVLLMINIPTKISYCIIDDKYSLKNIISYHWWYFPRQNYHIVSSIIFLWQKLSYHIDWPNQLSANTPRYIILLCKTTVWSFQTHVGWVGL